MVKKKSDGAESFLNKKVSNRLAYTIITFFAVIALAVVVYAVPGTTPNPGHSIAQLQPCSDGEILKTAAGVWTCSSSGAGSQWLSAATAGDIYYTAGKVGVGVAIPGSALDVSSPITSVSSCVGTATVCQGRSQSACTTADGCSWGTTSVSCTSLNQFTCSSKSGCTWDPTFDVEGACRGTYTSEALCKGAVNACSSYSTASCSSHSGCSVNTENYANFHSLKVTGTRWPTGKGLLLSPNDVALWGKTVAGLETRLLFLGQNDYTFINAPAGKGIIFRTDDTDRAFIDSVGNFLTRKGVFSDKSYITFTDSTGQISYYPVVFRKPGVSGASCATSCSQVSGLCMSAFASDGSAVSGGNTITCSTTSSSAAQCLCYKLTATGTSSGTSSSSSPKTASSGAGGIEPVSCVSPDCIQSESV